MNKPTVIKTECLTLRPLKDTDCRTTTEILLNSEIAKTYMLPEFESPAGAERLFEAYMRLSNTPDRFVYGIDLEGTIIGLLNETAKTEDEMELGYLIHPAHWGNGYATEALEGCIKTLFEMGYETIMAGFFEENVASRRVMEKCGMVATGKIEQIEYRNKKHTVILYEIKKQA